MPEKVMPGPVSDCSGIREAVCIHTRKILIPAENNRKLLEEIKKDDCAMHPCFLCFSQQSCKTI